MSDKQQIIEKVQKLFAIAKGNSFSKSDSAEIANEALSAMMMARKLLKKHHIDESELQLKAETEHIVYIAPSYGIISVTNPHKRANARGLNQRRIWFEKLAEVIAEGNYCKISIQPEVGGVKFFGLEMDREVAVFTFESLAAIADSLCKTEMKKAKAAAGAVNFRTGEKVPDWISEDCFIESFHQGFREVIKEILSDDEGNSKSSEGVTAFWLDNSAYKEKPEDVWNSYRYSTENIEVNDYHVGIGKKIGERACKKLKLDEGTEQIAGLIKTSQVKKQEQQQKKLSDMYKRLRIDESLPAEVIIALDTSGSMNSANKMEQAKEGAQNYAKDVSARGFKVGLVTFGRFPEEIFLIPNGLSENFTKTLAGLQADNSTPMHTAIEKSIEYFKGTKTRRYLMIVTDGAPDSRQRALEAAKLAKEHFGVIIQTIGTNDAPKEFLDKLSSTGEGIVVGNNSLGEGIKRMAGLLEA